MKCVAIPAATAVRQRRKMRSIVRAFLAGALFLLAPNPASLDPARGRALLPPWPASCRDRIKYRIGTVDPRFGITNEELRQAIEDAGNVWGNDRKRFEYDPGGGLRISLIYDTRQQITQRVIAARAGIYATLKDADLLKDMMLPLKDKFHVLEGSYFDQLASYKRALDSYNQDVTHWNLMGGVPMAEFQSLADKKQALQKQQNASEAARQALNRSTDELNELIKRHNALLTRANAEVAALNTAGYASIQFEEGRYVRENSEEWIDIFQFENRDGLLLILAHELGHALGLKHNANPSSIMSPLVHTDRLVLTKEDQDGLKAVCAPHEQDNRGG
jgi:hypothetical protein